MKKSIMIDYVAQRYVRHAGFEGPKCEAIFWIIADNFISSPLKSAYAEDMYELTKKRKRGADYSQWLKNLMHENPDRFHNLVREGVRDSLQTTKKIATVFSTSWLGRFYSIITGHSSLVICMLSFFILLTILAVIGIYNPILIELLIELAGKVAGILG